MLGYIILLYVFGMLFIVIVNMMYIQVRIILDDKEYVHILLLIIEWGVVFFLFYGLLHYLVGSL